MNYKLSEIYRKYRQINQIKFETENQTYSSFMDDCFQQIRVNLSAKTLIEARMDSAFFSEKMVARLDDENVELVVGQICV